MTRPAPRFTKAVRQLAAHEAESGEGPKHEAGPHGENRCERERRAVHRDLVQAGESVGSHPEKQIDPQIRESGAEKASQYAQGQALEQKRAEECGPPSPQGRTDGDLAMSAFASQQHEVGDVGARDQQDGDDRSK